MPFDIAQVDWVTLGIVAVVLVVGWTIVKTVLRLTMRVFSAGLHRPGGAGRRAGGAGQFQ